MSRRTEITAKTKEIVDTRFDVTEVNYVPDLENPQLTFGNKGMKFTATVLYIDMRESTSVLNNHNKPVVAKIHMAYFHTILKIAKYYSAEVRSFNGDSVLVFFPGSSKDILSNAVRSAMEMSYMITVDDQSLNERLKKYTSIDFGIGIDYGNILCTKVGLAGSNNRDLVWIGNAVNKAVAISDNCSDYYSIGISDLVYNNLNDDVKYNIKKNDYGQTETIDMWECYSVTYNKSLTSYYKTSYYWTVD
jgi:adenylate cyclase